MTNQEAAARIRAMHSCQPLPCSTCKALDMGAMALEEVIELQATVTACEAEVSTVYAEITDGRFSKMNTEAGHILDIVRDRQASEDSDLKAANRRVDAAKESAFHLNQQLSSASLSMAFIETEADSILQSVTQHATFDHSGAESDTIDAIKKIKDLCEEGRGVADNHTATKLAALQASLTASEAKNQELEKAWMMIADGDPDGKTPTLQIIAEIRQALKTSEAERIEAEALSERRLAALWEVKSVLSKPWKWDKAYSSTDDHTGRVVALVLVENIDPIVSAALSATPSTALAEHDRAVKAKCLREFANGMEFHNDPGGEFIKRRMLQYADELEATRLEGSGDD